MSPTLNHLQNHQNQSLESKFDGGEFAALFVGGGGGVGV